MYHAEHGDNSYSENRQFSKNPIDCKEQMLTHLRETYVSKSGEGRVLTLRRHYARPKVESGRGYTKAPEGGRDKGTLCTSYI